MTTTGLFLIGVAIGVILGTIALIVTWRHDVKKKRSEKLLSEVFTPILKEKMKTAKVIHLDEIEEFFNS